MLSYLELSASNLPAYLAYLATMVGLIAVFTFVYKLVTPYHELDLIRSGNKAAAVSLVGVVIGFALALNSIAAGSGSVADMAMWGVFALVSQLAVFLLISRLLGDLRQGIEEDRLGYGILLGGISVATGIVNAGALTY